MRKFKVQLYDQETGETTYGYVLAYTWAEAERLASNRFPGKATNVVDVVVD